MTMTRLFVLPLLFVFSVLYSANAQRWAVHLNVNEYYPLYAPEKGYYPIRWYSSDEGRGVLLGGFGGGVSWSAPLKGAWRLKAQANLLRSRYYDEPVLFVDEQGQSLGAGIGITTNLNATAFCIPAFQIARHWQIGAGLGLQSALLSKSDYGEAIIQGEKKNLKFKNKSIQPAVITLPVELACIFGRFSLSCRLEVALTKVSRLSYASDERFVNSVFELGYRFGAADETTSPVLNR